MQFMSKTSKYVISMTRKYNLIKLVFWKCLWGSYIAQRYKQLQIIQYFFLVIKKKEKNSWTYQQYIQSYIYLNVVI